MADGFLGRWSQRKQAVREGKPIVEPQPQALTPSGQDAGNQPVPSKPAQRAEPTIESNTRNEPDGGSGPAHQPQGNAVEKLPTLEDVQSLTPQSDFSNFVAPGVPSDVRNAAMKKLFADPHYSLIDGMDIYLEDYSLPSPLSAAVMAKMVSAKALKLVEEDEPVKEPSAAVGHTPGVSSAAAPPADAAPSAQDPVADTPAEPSHASQTGLPSGVSSSASSQSPIHHDHPDLRLQPNHAAGADDAGRGAK